MAGFVIQPDVLLPGSWIVQSDHPGALAAVCDAVVQTLALEGEALGLWALHYDEQDLHAEHAYARERSELGLHAQSQVVVLPTPYRGHTIFLNRLQLVAVAAPPAAGSRIAGLYVGSQGRDPRSGGDLLLSVHHPSVSHQVGAALARIPHGGPALQDGHELVADSRFVLHYDRQDDTVVRVRAPQAMALPVQESLMRLATLVATW